MKVRGQLVLEIACWFALFALIGMDQAKFQRLLASLGAGVPVGPGLPPQPWPRMSKTSRRKLRNRNWPDRLSGSTLPPPIARAVGEVELVRVFDSAEAAMTFLALARRGAVS